MLKIRLSLQVCLVLIIPFTVSASTINNSIFDDQLVDSHFTTHSRYMTHRNSGYEENPIQQHRNFKSFFNTSIKTNLLKIWDNCLNFSHLVQRSPRFKYIDLPPELWSHIASLLDYKTKLHHVNRYIFTAVTTYPWTDILKKGFAHLDTLPRPSGCKLKGMVIDFGRYTSDATIPSYILYSLIDEARFQKKYEWTHLKNTKISNLSLDTERLCIICVTNLIKVLTLNKIRVLDLSVNKFDLEDIKILAQALPSTHLRILKLSNSYFGDEGCIALAQVLPLTHIHTLDLNFNKIGLKGIKALADVLPFTEISILNLIYNRIGDEGALALAEALPKTKISNLNLKFNRMSEHCILILKLQFPHIAFEP